MKDTVSLIKQNGEKTDGIKASVQKRKVFIYQSNILIETGDLIHRKMSNGGEETYEVIDPGFCERHGGIQAHYQMDVKKVTRHVNSLVNGSEDLESIGIKETQNVIKIFISHSSKDLKFVEKLTELLKNALHLSAKDIRCTSIDAYGLPGGANTSEQLKSEVSGSKAFIGVVSYAAIDSMYVLFELGARWGANKHLLPLLAPGVSLDILKRPLSDLNAQSCDSASQLHKLVNDLAKELGIKPEESHTYQCYIDAILAIPPSGDNESLRSKVKRLENENLKAPSSAIPLQVPICPNCSTTGRPFCMSPIPKEFVVFENATHECSRCKYKTRVVSSPTDAF